MAVVDYFLKIDGIEGEAQDKTHKNEIQLESWSFGETQSGTSGQGGGAGAGKVAMQDFHFVMRVSKASPKLFLSCANGEHIKKAVLTVRKAGKDQQEYLKWTFTDLLISCRWIRFRSTSPKLRSIIRRRTPTERWAAPSPRSTTSRPSRLRVL